MAFKKNTAVIGFTFGLVSKTDGSDVTTGTPVGHVTLDGGIQTAIADVTPVHEGNGQWSFDLTAAEMNGAIIGLAFTHISAITVHFTIKTEVTTTSDLNNFNPATTPIATVTNLTNLPSMPANWITAAGIAASALNGKGNWNIGKTGYTLTQTFPANFADMAITLTTGKVTVGTNSDKAGYSISGTKTTLDTLNDIAATSIVSAGAINTLAGSVVKVDALTTYTGNTPQTGDGFAIVNDPVFGNSSIHDDVGSLSVGSAAISRQVASYVLTTGLLSSGLISNTETLDGVYHIHTDAAGAIDLYYEFSVGSNGTGTEVSFEGYLTGNNDSVGVYAYDWVGVKWDQIGTWVGSNSTTNVIPGPFVLLQRHTGSGADIGKIRMRLFAASGLTSATVAIDQIYATFAINETANITAILADTSTTLPAQITGLNNFNPAVDTVAHVALVDTTTANTDMRGTNGANTVVPDNASIASILTDTSTTLNTKLNNIQGATFSSVTDSLEAIRNRGDAAWTTGAGGTPPQLLQSTTIATLASQTSFTLTAGSADDNAYNGAVVVVTDSITSTQKAVGDILSYTGATKTITLSSNPGIFIMAAGDIIDIIANASSAPSASVVASAVWNEALTGHITAGTYGKSVADIEVDTSTTIPAQITALNDFNPATTPIATVTNLTNLPSIPANWITAAGIAASALNGKGNWNVGKTGYTLTQTFPANFADMAITLTTGKVTVGTNSDKTGYTLSSLPSIPTNWITAAGVAASALNGKGNWNIGKAGYSISGIKTTLDTLNDIAATSIVSAGAITTSLGKVSNVALVDTTTTNTDMRGTDGANTTAPDNTSIASILTDTGTTIPAQVTALNDFNPATNTVNIGKISGSVNAATRLSLSADQIIPFTVSTSILIPTVTDFQAGDITEATTDHYNGRVIIWTTGALAGQATSITAYSLAIGQGKFTVVGMTEAPVNGNTGVIV